MNFIQSITIIIGIIMIIIIDNQFRYALKI